MDQIGKTATNPAVKQLMNTKKADYQAVESMLDSGRTERTIKTKRYIGFVEYKNK